MRWSRCHHVNAVAKSGMLDAPREPLSRVLKINVRKFCHFVVDLRIHFQFLVVLTL